MSVYAQDYGYFFNSNSNDRTYNADSFETWLKPFFVSGVFTGCLQVQAQSTPDMTVKVTKGYANLDGKAAYWPSDNTLTIETASGIYDRIDTIVLRRDNTNRQVSLEVVKGTASATPSPTAPTRNSDTYELVLAEVLVGTGVTEIAGSAITDKRPDTDVCGYVVAAVQTPDFSELYAQFAAQAEEFMGDQADEFLAWFEEMKDQLSEDAAGHLQLEIDGKIDKVMSYFSPGEFPMLQSGGGLTGSGVKETSFASAASISAKNYTNLTNVPTNLSCGDVYVRNGEAFVVINANGIASGTAFSSLTSSDIAEMKLADEISSLNSKLENPIQTEITISLANNSSTGNEITSIPYEKTVGIFVVYNDDFYYNAVAASGRSSDGMLQVVLRVLPDRTTAARTYKVIVTHYA